MDIYWIKDKQRRGPATVPDVVSLIQMGEISWDTMGWHRGVDGWKPMRDLPALADFAGKVEPDDKKSTVQDTLRTFLQSEDPEKKPAAPAEKPQPGPAANGIPFPLPKGRNGQDDTVMMDVHLNSREADGINPAEVGLAPAGLRLLARLVDTSLYLAVGMGVLYMAGEPYDSVASPGGMLFWVPMILLEAFMLSRWGTTPGKKILGICVCTFGEQKELTFSRAFLRSLFVFILGMGMLMPLLAIIMMLVSLWLLRNKGICWWDIRALTFPIRKKRTSAPRIIFSLCGIYFAMTLAGYFMQPWVAPMYNDLLKVSPESARILEPFIPNTAGSPNTTPAVSPDAVQELPSTLVPSAQGEEQQG